MCHLRLLSAVSLTLLLAACRPTREADIVGAAVIAELAQTQNARPADFSVDKVAFQSDRQATVTATQRFPEGRLPHSATFSCDAAMAESRWHVKCVAQRTE